MKYKVNDKEVSRNEFVKKMVKVTHECYQQSFSNFPVNERIVLNMIKIIEQDGCAYIGGEYLNEQTKFGIVSEANE